MYDDGDHDDDDHGDHDHEDTDDHDDCKKASFSNLFILVFL